MEGIGAMHYRDSKRKAKAETIRRKHVRTAKYAGQTVRSR